MLLWQRCNIDARGSWGVVGVVSGGVDNGT